MAANNQKKFINELIERAKIAVIKKDCGATTTIRRWLESWGPDSYDDKNYRIKLFVLEGSPARGYVIANYYTNSAIAFDGFDKKIKTFKEHLF